MSFAFLQINNLRNLADVQIAPAPDCNLLCGANGSGKTSFFEAIYYLILGRSFRTRHTSQAITHNADALSIFAKIQKEEELVSLGVERHHNGKNLLRINKVTQTSMLEATQTLPILLLSPESRHLLTASSKIRRGFLDWGVFHVEPAFILPWQQAQRILKQRNAALKKGSHRTMIELWDSELEKAAHLLHAFRQNYLYALEPILRDILTVFFNNTFDFSFKYKAGWDEEAGLVEALKKTLHRDLQLGHTQHGPHRADMLIRINNTPAQYVLSQGQQKLLVYALYLAQGILLKQQSGKKCVFLLDDLPAELDIENQKRVAQVLHQIDAQVFITSVDRTTPVTEIFKEIRMFHVEHGNITTI